MAPRRSNRLRDPPNQEPSDAVQDTLAQVEKGTKRKNSTVQNARTNAEIPKRAKKDAKFPVEIAAAGEAEGPDTQGLDKLSSLPPDIFDMIANNITEPMTISALSRSSKGLYTLMAPRLYGRVSVAAMFHAHIAKVIRTLEPHLTIQQKKQLKREGKYKGQQERYPTGLDEKKVPVCASYVRQLVIGASDPGKKHRYIVERYYEEALKNMKNLEVLETRVMNRPMCEAIASLPRLKALAIYAENTESDDLAPLTCVKNLKHLVLQINGFNTDQSVIRNSMSTLQSLDIITYLGSRHFFRDWEKNLKSNGHNTASRVHKGSDFPVLRSLRMEHVGIDEEFTKEFPKAIDFSKLRELTTVNSNDDQNLLWPFLTNLVTSYKQSNTPLDLRTLSMDMDDSKWRYDAGKQKAELAVKLPFIASFDTLTTLELLDYGLYKSNHNPGLSDALLQTILKHKSLRVLKICYKGVGSDVKIPYIGAKSIADIVDGLPYLRELEFAPDEQQMVEISQALWRGGNLESVTCFPHESWVTYPPPDQLGQNILSCILSTFLCNVKPEANGRNFVWEDHYKLKRLDLRHKKWDIASKFSTPKSSKREKGWVKPGKIEVDAEEGKREVWYQVVPPTVHIHIGFDPLFEWVTKVQREIE